jgi:hypothetical protein
VTDRLPSDTRNAAHDRVQPTKSEVWARILSFAASQGTVGLTADELADLWQCSHNHVAPRISELYDSGDLVVTDERRPTRTGCLARVYVAKQFAPKPAEMKSLFGDISPDRTYQE